MPPLPNYHRRGSHILAGTLLVLIALVTVGIIVIGQFGKENTGRELTAQLAPPDTGGGTSSSDSSASSIPEGCTQQICDLCAGGGNVCEMVNGNCQCIGGLGTACDTFCLNCTAMGGDCSINTDGSICSCTPPGSCGNGIRELGEECEQTSDCASGENCFGCQCTSTSEPLCFADSDCGAGACCNAGQCSTDCGGGGGCTVDSDCTGGTCCDTDTGQCSAAACGVQCPAGIACIGQIGCELQGGSCVSPASGSGSCDGFEGCCCDLSVGGQCGQGETCSDNVACATGGGTCGASCGLNSCCCTSGGGGGCITDADCSPGSCCMGGQCAADACGNRCGDGTLDAGEECDDGNTTGGDGCSASCKNEVCGNGTVDPGEQCDLGADNGKYLPPGSECTRILCNTDCSVPHCGDGTLNQSCVSGDYNEECDDGNTVSNDGCSASCMRETGCCADPSLCTGVQQCNAQSCACEAQGCTVSSDCPGQNTCCVSRLCVQAECGDGRVQCSEECEPSSIQKLCVRGDGVVLMGCGNQSQVGDACGNGPCMDSDGDGNGNCQGAGGTACRMDDDCMGSCEFRTNDPCCTADCTSTGSPTCTAGCGNGTAEAGETCLNCPQDVVCSNGTQCCSDGSCQTSCGGGGGCGDGIIDSGETCLTCPQDVMCGSGTQCCSDGSCQTSCGGGQCGDNRIDPGEECEENTDCAFNEVCGSSCQCDPVPVFCGNVIIDAPQEQCDDGGTCTGGTADGSAVTTANEAIECKARGGQITPISGDGCADSCILEHECGNGIPEFIESCDDGGVCTAGNVGKVCTLLTVIEDCGQIGICEPEAGDGCDASCGIEECAVLGKPGDINAYTWSLYNLGFHQDGMYNAATYSPPADPRGLEWFSDTYKTFFGLYNAKGSGNDIREVPFIGPVENVPLDPSYFGAKWEGVLHVPERGNYTYHFGARDDIWVVIDGVVHSRDTGLKSTLTTNRRSIILQPGDHTVEVYYASRTPADCRMLIEIACEDGRDDDRDTKVDCTDSDCSYALACGGTGCKAPEQCDSAGSVSCPNGSVKEDKGTACVNGGQCVLCKEIACDDTLDNDGDLRVDGADNDCQNLQSSLPSSREKFSLREFFIEKAHAEATENAGDAGEPRETILDSFVSLDFFVSFLERLIERAQSMLLTFLPEGSSLLGQVTGTAQCSDGLDNDGDQTVDFQTFINTQNTLTSTLDQIIATLVDENEKLLYILAVPEGQPGITPQYDPYVPYLYEVSLPDYTILRNVRMPLGNYHFAQALIDPVNDKAYFGGFLGSSNPVSAAIVKVDLNTMTVVTPELTITGITGTLGPAVIDVGNGFAYYGTYTFSDIGTQVIKINLQTFQQAGSVALAAIDERELTSAAIDTAAGFAYFASSPGQDPRITARRIVKIQLNPLQRVGFAAVSSSDTDIRALSIDPQAGKLYAASFLNGGASDQIRVFTLSPFALTAGTISLNSADGAVHPRSVAIDTVRKKAYYGTSTSKVVKVNLTTNQRETAYDMGGGSVITTFTVPPIVQSNLQRVIFAKNDSNIFQVGIADTDPQCSSASDSSESIECSDGIDNSDTEDSLADANDPGCRSNGNVLTGTYNASDDDESNAIQCGNGGVETGEQCDDGNTVNTDACNNSCQGTPQCGDSIDNADAEDSLADANDPGCRSNGNVVTGTYNSTDTDESHTPSCGNGAIDQAPEQCDDGNTVNGDDCSQICRLEVTSTIYAGGTFTQISGQVRNRLAEMNAMTGQVGGWNPDVNGLIRTLFKDASTMYAGGDFTTVGGQPRNRIAAFDLQSGLLTNWSPDVNGTINGDVYTMFKDGNTVYIGGSFTAFAGQTRNRLAALDATTGLLTSWSPNVNGNVHTILKEGNTIYAGGEFTTVGGQTREHLAAIDATTGQVTGSNMRINGNVYTMYKDGNVIYVGGSFSSVDGQTRNRLAAISGTQVTGWVPEPNNDVYTMLKDGNVIYVGGKFTTVLGQARNRLASFDMTTGQMTSWNPNANNDVRTIIKDGSTIYAGGNFTSVGGQTRNYLAALSATTGLATNWNPVVNNQVQILALGTVGRQCSDGIDNNDPEDSFADRSDLGCYSNGNIATGIYDPNDDNETNIQSCGNGTVETPEECDDGNTSNTDACPDGTGGTCRIATCGDGFVHSGTEACDEGTQNGQPNRCNTTCNGTTSPVCGNGIAEQGEQCDDGNTNTSDGCTNACAYGEKLICHALGNETTIGTISSQDAFRGTDSFVAVFPGGSATARIGTAQADGSIVWDTSAYFVGVSNPVQMKVKTLDQSRFVVVASNASQTIAVIGERVGNTIVFGSPNTFVNAYAVFDIDRLTSNRFVVTYTIPSQCVTAGCNASVYAGEVAGRTITFDYWTGGISNVNEASYIVSVGKADTAALITLRKVLIPTVNYIGEMRMVQKYSPQSTTPVPISGLTSVAYIRAQNIDRSSKFLLSYANGCSLRIIQESNGTLSAGAVINGVCNSDTAPFDSNTFINTSFDTASSPDRLVTQVIENGVVQSPVYFSASIGGSIFWPNITSLASRVLITYSMNDVTHVLRASRCSQCENTTDDDGDSLIDTSDLGCFDFLDDDERNACTDTLDNDSDTFIDNILNIKDPGCYSPPNVVTGTYNPQDMTENHTPACGNGAIDQAGEQCDDGNIVSGDNCSATCRLEVCGNGVTDPSEQCDDGNQSNTDGCLTTCQNASCGDSFVRTGIEQCDNGPSNSNTTPNACRLDCRNPRCGDNVTDSGEACDDGSQNGLPTKCNATCTGTTAAVCGNSVIEAPAEQCDDGDGNNNDNCPDGTNGTCRNSICGDSHLWNQDGGTEQCDDGNAVVTDACPSGVCIGGTQNGQSCLTTALETACQNGGGACNMSSLCKPARCGDGFVRSGTEICDDGNGANGDACPDGTGGTCRTAACGDGFVFGAANGGTEVCDDGDGNKNDSCPDGAGLACAAARCGDGFLWNTDGGTEECDDGNTTGGDGCASACTFENALLCADMSGPATITNKGTASVSVFPDQRSYVAITKNGLISIGKKGTGGLIIWGQLSSPPTITGQPVANAAVATLDDTRIAVIASYLPYSTSNGLVRVVIGTVNSVGNIVWGSPLNLENSWDLTTALRIAALSPTRFVALYHYPTCNSSNIGVTCPGKLALGNVNGTVVTAAETLTLQSPYFDIAAIDANRFAVAWSPFQPLVAVNMTMYQASPFTTLTSTQVHSSQDANNDITHVAIDASPTSVAVAYGKYNNCHATHSGLIDTNGTVTFTERENGCSTGLTDLDVQSIDGETSVLATHQTGTNHGSWLHIIRGSQNTQSITLDPDQFSNSTITVTSIDNGLVATYQADSTKDNAKILYCAACQNRKDDDGDGQADLGVDLGCSALLDDDERNICTDTLDNDSDTFIDNRTNIQDPGCYLPENIVSGNYTPQDMNESHTVTCGNGRREGTEQCDDGDNISNDSCPDGTGAPCTNARCGDGILWNTDGGNEQCDDGDNNRNDACPDGGTATCQNARCGDGFVYTEANGGNEFCDDADTDNFDACTNTCFRARCGDGFRQPRGGDDLQGTADDEACDEGALNGQPNRCNWGCTGITLLYCSNGVVEHTGAYPWENEQCDDGNRNDNDSCPDNVPVGAVYGYTYGRCQNAVCGDGFLWTIGGTEQCDDANTSNTDACTTACRPAACGDGYHQPKGADNTTGTSDDEQCDSGASNSTNPNSCRPGCLLPLCGDGILDNGFGESCDAGIENGQPLKCNATCNGITQPICGNAVIESGETCDDGGQNGQPNRCNSSCNGVTPANCGNAVIETGEQCDFGSNCQGGVQNGQTCNTQARQESCFLDGGMCNANFVPDACRSDCQLPRCGDNVRDTGEQCDNGSQNGQPLKCNLTCTGITTPVCGNLVIESGETCDDGAENGRPNKCNTSCNGITSSSCGNKVIEQGEQCDNGNTCTGGTRNGQSCLSTTQQELCFSGGGICNADTVADACRTGCVLKRCGDNVRDTGEQCDNGSQNGQPNKCNILCTGITSPVCGNTVIEAGETCDDGSQNGQPLKCNVTCNGTSPAVCGNAVIEAGETCDDGTQNGQPLKCNVTCNGTSPAVCGNAVVEAGETCDEGVLNGQPLRCNTSCNGMTSATCGNRVVEQGEQCDDGTTCNGGIQNGNACNTQATEEACFLDGGSCNANFVPDACRTGCQRPRCGDNVKDSNEQCDNGIQNGQPLKCNTTCTGITGAICGNAVVEAGETCDDGVQNGLPLKCSTTCNGVTPPRCGNAVIEAGETCDDGVQNGLPLKCSLSCNGVTPPLCGNAVVEAGETCDDGNLNGQPLKCNVSCSGITDPACGNGAVEQGEQCDDGNLKNNDMCPDGGGGSCDPAFCGDGFTWNTAGGTEECDDGGNNSNTAPNACRTSCKRASCGDSVQDAGESCDDGNNNKNDACPDGTGGICIAARCGDGFLWNQNGGTEICDEGMQNGQPNHCNMFCTGLTPSVCGNAWVEAGETCDDGDHINADRCPDGVNGTCLSARCGDRHIWNTDGGTEACDDGSQNGSPNQCNATCTGITPPECGNAIIEQGENCDDGNRNNNDSCPDGVGGICQLAACGDAFLWNTDGGTETCDDGSQNGTPLKCNTACSGITAAICGNGVAEAGEDCDDANQNNNDACPDVLGSGSCKAAACGDAYVWNEGGGTEVCDDGTDNGKPLMCNTACSDTTLAVCGNGYTERGEECDDFNTQNLDGCSAACRDEHICTLADIPSAVVFYFDPWPGLTITPREACMPACGDGAIDNGEECDDGNIADEDGCNAVCKLEYCGDAVIQTTNEQCDPGYTCAGGAACTPGGAPCSDGSTCALRCVASEICSNTCQIPTCGNGDIECGEQCDPGLHGECENDATILCNLLNNDAGGFNPACLDTSARCQLTSGFCNDGSGTICDDDFDCERPNKCAPVPNDACCDLSCADLCGNSECSTDSDCGGGECCLPLQSGNICGACPMCGNKTVDPSEECDDGKNCVGQNGGIVDCTSSTALCAEPATCAPLGGDGCNPLCRNEVCGNDVLDPGEECDDGKQCENNRTVSCQTDAECSALAFCTPGTDGVRRCPNGDRCSVNSDCSDKCIQIDTDTCNNKCESSGGGGGNCGNGQIEAGETCGTCPADAACQSGTQCCSDGSCQASCTGGVCGNGTIDAGETCATCSADVSCQSGTQCCSDGTCRSSCTPIACNNNSICDSNETCACDDCAGEQDGCLLGFVCDSATDQCVESICGNGAIEPREHCDSSVPPSGQGPTWLCDPLACILVNTCGNGVEELGEQCEQGEISCRQNCTIDQCAAVRASDGTGFMMRRFNLPSWRYGMDNPGIDGPPDPVFDPYLWWSDVYLKEVVDEGSFISHSAPFNGPDDSVDGDPAHHSAVWYGTVTVPQNGFYSYTYGTRDDAWILVDGIIVDAVRGIQNIVDIRQSSIFLPEGTHTVEIYYVSRQKTAGLEGMFFFSFDQANLPVQPYLPNCSFCGNAMRETGETCDDGFRNGQGAGLCNSTCTGYGAGICGNGIKEAGEDCDDGNTASGDGCSDLCKKEPLCGDRVRDAGEECDDGNTASGDGCSNICQLETICGNSRAEGAEQCDDGNTSSGDGCSSTCQVELTPCGNTIIDQNEQCDFGGLCIGGGDGGKACRTALEALDCKLNGGNCIAQSNDGDACDSECRIEVPAVCGDGIRQGFEECDYGTCGPNPTGACNDNSRADMCRLDCTLPRCGDSVQDSGEQCDTGDNRSDILPDQCRLSCELPRCGDDTVDLGEQCDDGSLNHDLLPDRCRSACTNPVCGDHVIDPQFNEQCDDGNTDSNDGCSGTCREEAAVCGNGRREPGEECDDGNTTSGDSCSATCTVEVSATCGDGVLQTENGEQCDDGNAVNTDACDIRCQFTICGDGVPQVLNGQGGTEECDDANMISTDTCTNTCRNAVCGDSVIHEGTEECDDGNQSSADLCTALCTMTKCGDSTVQTPNSFGVTEVCDDGNTVETDSCTNLCAQASCGDGLVFAGIEQCDDGNRIDGDGCSSLCVLDFVQPLCGNGRIDQNEQCDDSNAVAGDGCSPLCQREVTTGPAICGNAILETGEACDDGNVQSGDTCNANCTLPDGGGGGGGVPPSARCANRLIERGEQCDDGNFANGDGCDNHCQNETPLTCGNGTVESPEQCDQGAFNSSVAADACRSSCKNPYCGDGVQDTRAGEDCDDGNTLPGDGCSSICVSEVITVGCGNGSVDSGEECDTGSSNSDARSDACRTNCRFAVCGDAVLDRGRSEQCDDGNRNSNDGCSSSCQIELAGAHPAGTTPPFSSSEPEGRIEKPTFTPNVTYDSPLSANVNSALGETKGAPATPSTGPETIITITLAGAALAAWRRKRKDLCNAWPKGW